MLNAIIPCFKCLTPLFQGLVDEEKLSKFVSICKDCQKDFDIVTIPLPAKIKRDSDFALLVKDL